MTVALKGTDFAKSFEVTVKFADKTALNEVIAEAGKLADNTLVVTVMSKLAGRDCKSGSDEFEAAFDAAEKVAADEDATPAQVADALAALQAARKALVKVDGEKPGPQKPAVKPSPNGKVDATEPSGLSKTGASTMAFAVAAVLLLAAGAGVVLLRRRAE